MAVQLNHTIVWARDQRASAEFLADILGLPAPKEFGPFTVVDVSNGVSLDFHSTDAEIMAQHYAFLISEKDFDEVFERIKERGLTYWADPFHNEQNVINTNDGGRGLYWDDPDGHALEVITRPYGSGV